jgi:hypothetical protein
MRLLNTRESTRRKATSAFIRRAEYEIKHAYPQPACRSGQTGSGPQGYIKWAWPAHSLSLKARMDGIAILRHPDLAGGAFAIPVRSNSGSVQKLFYMMFDLLSNDDQAMRILTEPYKGP